MLVRAPLAFNALRGMIRQLIRQPNYLAAIPMGAGPWRLSRWHVLPNSLPRTVPLFLHIIGVAMAVYGMICVFGFVNRTELDLGACPLQARVRSAAPPTGACGICADFCALRFAIWKVGRSA